MKFIIGIFSAVAILLLLYLIIRRNEGYQCDPAWACPDDSTCCNTSQGWQCAPGSGSSCCGDYGYCPENSFCCGYNCCPDGMECRNGDCFCTASEQCGEGYYCNELGKCQVHEECSVNTDCPNSKADIFDPIWRQTQVCVNKKCVTVPNWCGGDGLDPKNNYAANPIDQVACPSGTTCQHWESLGLTRGKCVPNGGCLEGPDNDPNYRCA